MNSQYIDNTKAFYPVESTVASPSSFHNTIDLCFYTGYLKNSNLKASASTIPSTSLLLILIFPFLPASNG